MAELSSVWQLYQLQDVDLEINQRQERLAKVEQSLGDEGPLEEPRNVVAEHRSRLSQLQRDQREAELQSAGLREKRESLEKKLFSGTVRNPRELKGMQQELGYLQNHQGEAEDRLLEALVAVEECQAALASGEQLLARVEQEWSAQQAELQQEREVLQRELAALQKQRSSMVAGIPAADLAVYQQLCATRGGRAVSRVERGMCQACRISLPTRELQQVRTSSGLVRCSNCGRILYLS